MTRIIIKNNDQMGEAPDLVDLELGELAINTYDGKLFLKKDDGTEEIVEIGAGGLTAVEDDPAPKLAANLDADGNTVINLAAPTQDHHAATKEYVDDLVVGGVRYKGQADASEADPEDATGNTGFQTGDMYRISVAGSAFGFAANVGDFVIYNGATWDRIDAVDPAVSGTADRITVTGSEATGFVVDIATTFGLDGLADVALDAPADGDILVYNAAESRFENVDEINGGSY